MAIKSDGLGKGGSRRCRSGYFLIAIALGSVAAPTQNAFACRGIMNWPKGEADSRIKPDHVVVKARLEKAYASANSWKSIMGSSIDFVYKVAITSILKSPPDAGVSSGDKLLVWNEGHVCEFYRPWQSARDADIDPGDVRTLVLLKSAEGWNVVGGEERQTPGWPKRE